MRILNRSFNSEKDITYDPNESLGNGSSKYAFALKESKTNSRATSERDSSEGDEMKIINMNNDSGAMTPRSEQKKQVHGSNNLMGLLEEVGSLGSLEDSDNSVRSSDAQNIKRTDRFTDNLDKSGLRNTFQESGEGINLT